MTQDTRASFVRLSSSCLMSKVDKYLVRCYCKIIIVTEKPCLRVYVLVQYIYKLLARVKTIQYNMVNYGELSG